MKAILTFHSIDDSGSVLSFPGRALERLLEGFQAAQLPVVDLDTLLAPETPRGIALTFDDGMRSVHDHALPVLRHHGAPAHLFLATGAVGRDNRWPGQPRSAPAFEMLGWREIESLREAGMRFECHTHSHPDLTAVGRDVMAAECERADRIIESRLGRRPAYFAYPYGRLTAVASDYARRRYRASVTTVLGALAGGEDPAALPRIDTYYLRSRWIHQRLDSPVSQAWLTLRAVLRRIRGST